MAAELKPGGVDSACHPSEVGEMSTAVLVEGRSISGTAALPRNESYPAAKLPYARTDHVHCKDETVSHHVDNEV